MQIVNFTKDYFDLIEKNTLLTLEQAQWFTQNEGFIPLPRKCNKKNTYVMFSEGFPHFLLSFKNMKVKKYRITEVAIKPKQARAPLKYIIVVELEKSKFNTNYIFSLFYDSNFYDAKIMTKTKYFRFYINCWGKKF